RWPRYIEFLHGPVDAVSPASNADPVSAKWNHLLYDLEGTSEDQRWDDARSPYSWPVLHEGSPEHETRAAGVCVNRDPRQKLRRLCYRSQDTIYPRIYNWPDYLGAVALRRAACTPGPDPGVAWYRADQYMRRAWSPR